MDFLIYVFFKFFSLRVRAVMTDLSSTNSTYTTDNEVGVYEWIQIISFKYFIVVDITVLKGFLKDLECSFGSKLVDCIWTPKDCQS